MICPICKAEYRAGHTRCKDCDVELVDRVELRPSGVRRIGYDSAALLWRGSDPVIYTALVSTLREAHIPFYDTPARDYEAYLSSPFPSPFNAAPGFEVRVRASDLKRAEHILEALLDQEPEDMDIVTASDLGIAADGPSAAQRDLPEDWDPVEATVEIWTGHDIALARFLSDIFRENAIPCRESVELPATHHLLVRPPDAPMARELLREIISGTPPS